MPLARSWWLALSSVLVTLGCADGPAERFEREGARVIEGRCASEACHGVGPSAEWPASPGFFVRVDAEGRLADLEEARAAAASRVSVRAPRTSSLLRIPSPAWAGGGPHAGGALFTGPDEPALEALMRWIESEPRGGEDLELTPLEARFRDDVMPTLVTRCARSGCHGSRDVAFAAFPIHPVAPDGAIGDPDVRAARLAVRAFLDLWGADPRRSRLLRKALGEEDGIVHRGGLGTFFAEAPPGAPFDAPALAAILEWVRAERSALGVEDGRAPSGVVFVAGPPASRTPYRITTGPLGSDLFLAGWPSSGTPENLTASLHPDGEVEIRDPAITHDGDRVAFAMRRSTERRFSLWELSLSTREVRRASPEGANGSFVQPVYAPDGRLVAAWDGHGELGADGDGVAPELVALSRAGIERLTYTPAPEVSPSVLASGKTRGMLLFGTRREGPGGVEGVLFRFPLCHDEAHHGEPEYHIQIGASVAPAAPLVGRDLPDGRQVMIVLAGADADDDRGALALLDRSLGPDLGEVTDDATLGGYRAPFTWLDPAPRFRDPAPLPDGRVLVSVDDGLALAEIIDGSGGASLGALEPWMSMEGRALRSPVPVLSRPLEDDGHQPLTDSALQEGFLALRDVAVLESIYGRAAPRFPRELRDDLVGLRLIASDRALADGVRRTDDGGTTVGRSSRIPARVLAELSLPADRSAWLAVPARTPILVQLVDAWGMQVGRGLDRWVYAEGGEVVPGGTNIATYAHACAGCHGASSGDPADAAGPPPDVLSSASVTLSTHAQRDRRRPLAPAAMSPGTERVDFVTTIRPRLEACVGCHGGAGPAADLALDDHAVGLRFAASYEALVRFVDLETLRARRSPLMERLLGRELEAAGVAGGPCPPEGADDALVRAMARWIEAGAFFDVTRRREGE